MDTVDIVVVAIGVITIGLLITALILVRTVYAVVRRERAQPVEPEQ
jgi:hypothetical protein